MKIGAKITLIVAAAVVGLVVVFALSLSTMGTLNDLFLYIGNTPVKNAVHANDVLNQLNVLARQSAMQCFDKNRERNSGRGGKIDSAMMDMKSHLDSLEANVHAPEMKEIVKKLRAAMDSVNIARASFNKMLDAGRYDEAGEYRITDFSVAINALEAHCNEACELTGEQTNNAAFVDSPAVVSSSTTQLIIIAIIVAIVLVVFAVIIIMGITRPLNKAVNAANAVALGDLKVDLSTTSKDETGILMHSLENMINSISGLLKDTESLAKSAIDGKLEVRADITKHKGAYQELIQGVNGILDAVIGPLNMTAEYVDRISKGDMPPKVTDEYRGDFNEIKNNINGCIDSITLLVNEINTSIKNALDGNFKYRADAMKFTGDYRRIMEGTNSLVEAFIEPLNMTSAFLQAAADGDSVGIKSVTKDYKGDFNVIKNAINKLHDTLFAVLDEMTSAADEAKKGNLNKKADSSKMQGAWVVILEGLNSITSAANAIITDAGGVLSTMATGDLTPRIKKEYPGKFGEMKNNINNLGDSLTDLISRLTEAIHTTATASAEISATAETIATATQEQSSQTDEVAGAVEEMSRTVTNNAQNAAKTADVAKNSGDTANKGGKVVEHTVAKMREISDVVKSSAQNIAKLGESSKKIGEIIGVIDDIADQTNLLSLNAAIEAARAGEQGRGFAVVADSVGKLAISTASATKEIADMIKGIQTDTEAAVRAMEKGTSEVQSGIELADSAGTSIKDIVSGINELLDMVSQIAAASEEQSATSEEISKNVSSISKVVADSARNIEDVASTANELAKMTETLTSLISQFKIDETGSRYSSNNSSYSASSNDEEDDYPPAANATSSRYLN